MKNWIKLTAIDDTPVIINLDKVVLFETNKMDNKTYVNVVFDGNTNYKELVKESCDVILKLMFNSEKYLK